MTTKTTKILEAKPKLSKPVEHKKPRYNRAIAYSLDEKIDQLNECAKLRGKFFEGREKVNDKTINQGLIEFIKELSSTSNNKERKNNRVISLLFFLADIKKEKHALNYNQLDNDEQIRLVEAVNQLKAVCSILPTDLAIK